MHTSHHIKMDLSALWASQCYYAFAVKVKITTQLFQRSFRNNIIWSKTQIKVGKFLALPWMCHLIVLCNKSLSVCYTIQHDKLCAMINYGNRLFTYLPWRYIFCYCFTPQCNMTFFSFIDWLIYNNADLFCSILFNSVFMFKNSQ